MKWHDRAAVQCATGGGGWYRAADVDALLTRILHTVDVMDDAVCDISGASVDDTRIDADRRYWTAREELDVLLTDGGE